MNTKQIITSYIQSLAYRRLATRNTYTLGVKTYVRAVGVNAPIDLQTYIRFLKSLQSYSAGTQRVMQSAVMGLYKFYCLEYDQNVNLIAMKEASRVYLKKESVKLRFDRDAVSTLVRYAEIMKCDDKDLNTELRNLRDRAFILTCVDSGLRISEACNFKRGDILWEKRAAYTIGKGSKEEKIHLSNRALAAIKKYLDKRSAMDGATGVPLETLPLFARHDRGGGKKVKPVKAGGMWAAFVSLMEKAGIEKSAISPHKLRHEAVTRFYEETKDIKKTMEFSRHARLDTVDRYTHLVDSAVDQSYDEIFNKESK